MLIDAARGSCVPTPEEPVPSSQEVMGGKCDSYRVSIFFQYIPGSC